MVTVYCFTGLPAAGKSKATSIAAEHGLPVVVMGDVVRERARDELGEDATSSEIGEWATQHRDEYGNDIFAQYTANEIAEQSEETVLVDGLRTETELSVFRSQFDEVQLILVDAPFETRLSRIQSRNREDEGEYTAGELEERDARERDWGLNELIENERYDTVLSNTEGISKLESKVNSLIT